ncbi:acyl-protein synthetase [Niveibacterium umoris]|uniref:Acyl-protein synthetase LuxE domain-containing protein n=1 Tax=Niveibacterium umoris TaxID=1193620 RepID=A0A840BFW6_9RHOO|nr:acyl-protein synthetase [Niveibacterium umoris]MBB4011910.1 hypothetical protein [Niveibacterium umoris]
MSEWPTEPDFSAPFGETQAAKRARLLPRLRALTLAHAHACLPYSRMLDALHPGARDATTLESLAWLPVGVFKHLRLASVADADVVRELRSSGTSGSQPSRILLDRATAARQTRALAAIVGDFLGKARRPMLVIDRNDLLRGSEALSARAAAVLGFANFGRQPAWALTPDLAPDFDAIDAFSRQHGDQPVLVFGFTFMIWRLLDALEVAGRRLTLPRGSILIHGGGWKKLADLAVDNARFKARIASLTGLTSVHDYYGMAEQVGSIFMECEAGRLHTPRFADVIVRDPLTLAPCAAGETGVIQVLSELPTSYPGHSLLTEDLGSITGEDDCPCGRTGRTLHVVGRLPRAELRGCSDTRAG